MSADVVVGLDIGTTSTKALVVGADGTEVADRRVRTHWTRSAGWSETTADALYEGSVAAVTAALQAAERVLGHAPAVVGIGICGMGESGVLLAPDGTSTAPVIAWFDPRGTAEMAALPQQERDAFAGTTGLPVSALSTLAKLLWLRGHGVLTGPGTCWLNVPEYVAHRLGAERASEPSLASRTGLLEQATTAPWTAALDLLDARADLLPPLRRAGTALGAVAGPDLPPGLAGAAVVVAGHDHPVASFGAGAWGPDDLFDSCGTAESVLRIVARPLSDSQRAALVELGLTAGHHVLSDRWVVAGPTRGGIVLGRVLAMLGCTDGAARERLDAAWLPAQDPTRDPARGVGRVVVEGAGMGCDQVVVRTDADDVGPDDVWAAALVHVSDTVATLAGSIDEQVGSTRRRVVAAGGWTRMASVRGQKLRALPDVTFSPRSQPGAFGAATLAAWAASGEQCTPVQFAGGFVGGSARAADVSADAAPTSSPMPHLAATQGAPA